VAAVSAGLKAIETLGKIAFGRDDNGDAYDTRSRVEANKILLNQFNGITALVAGSALVKSAEEDLTEAELEELAQTPDGVQKLLAAQRERTGRA